MERTLRIGRREFTERGLLVLLGGVAVTVSGCGGGSGGGGGMAGPSGSGGGTGNKVGSISGNHGHEAVLDAARLSAGNEVTLEIRGSADHPHSVFLSAEEVQAIAANERVSKTSSSDDAHTHVVTFN